MERGIRFARSKGVSAHTLYIYKTYITLTLPLYIYIHNTYTTFIYIHIYIHTYMYGDRDSIRAKERSISAHFGGNMSADGAILLTRVLKPIYWLIYIYIYR